MASCPHVAALQPANVNTQLHKDECVLCFDDVVCFFVSFFFGGGVDFFAYCFVYRLTKGDWMFASQLSRGFVSVL